MDFDDEPPEQESDESRAERHLTEVMYGAHVTMEASLQRVMHEAVTVRGKFEPPLVLMTGRLHFQFDELERLKATIAAVAPFSAGNKELQQAIETVNELMKTPWLSRGSGEVARGLADRIRKSLKRGGGHIDPSRVEEHTERMLLEDRCYQKRSVFGGEQIRALLAPSTGKTRIPVYLPAMLKDDLPMFLSIGVRLIAEAHAQQDQYESHECSLRVVAMGRIVHIGRASAQR